MMVHSLLAGKDMPPRGGQAAPPRATSANMREAIEKVFANPQITAAIERITIESGEIERARADLETARQAFEQEMADARQELLVLQADAIAAAATLAKISQEIAEKDSTALTRAATAEAELIIATAGRVHATEMYEAECRKCEALETRLAAAISARAELEGKLAAALASMRSAPPAPPVVSKGWKMAVSGTDANGFPNSYTLKPEV